MQLINIK